MLTDQDIYLFREGTHFRAYEKLGAHLVAASGERSDGEEQSGAEGAGTHFAVWAPNAQRVAVVGDFNGWRPDAHPLTARPDSSGIWSAFVPGVKHGALYKYHIESSQRGYTVQKADPYGYRCELPPRTASVVWDLSYEWHDAEWMEHRAKRNALDAATSVVRSASGFLAPRAPRAQPPPQLPRDGTSARRLRHRDGLHSRGVHARDGASVLRLLGYQITGYFAPTSRYGTPQDFKYLVDHLHQRGIGVILDWVPSHFPSDEHGLAFFDGTHLYEHEDPRQGFHPEWNSSIFNYGRAEVRNFLGSNALFWLEEYHVDGLRVDAVASMLYLDYARKAGGWVPNKYGGNENLDAVEFLRNLNLAFYRDHPDTQTIAEESTAWPGVSRPVYLGGLGFGLKWNMGWMHDTLKYFQTNPIFRKYEHNKLTFGLLYAFTENFVLPLSHDEVVHGKGSLIGKMSGDEWQQFANLRLLLGYMWGHVGKKLLFMGGEFGQKREWTHEESLEWHVLQYPLHDGAKRWMRDVNLFYRDTPALYQKDFSGDGFEWIDCNDTESSTLAWLRKGTAPGDYVLVVCNFTPVPRDNFRVGVPRGGQWRERLNSDAQDYGGGGIGNFGIVESAPLPAHGRNHSLTLRLPPLAVLFLTPA